MKKKLISISTLFLTLFLAFPNAALAQSLKTCVPALGGNGIDTAIGCIPVGHTSTFVGWMLGWAIGISGGIAFIFIVFAAIQMMTAQGDPQKLSGGRELLTAAISGLILIIFSVFLLRVIGINILQLNTAGF